MLGSCPSSLSEAHGCSVHAAVLPAAEHREGEAHPAWHIPATTATVLGPGALQGPTNYFQ